VLAVAEPEVEKFSHISKAVGGLYIPIQNKPSFLSAVV